MFKYFIFTYNINMCWQILGWIAKLKAKLLDVVKDSLTCMSLFLSVSKVTYLW